MRTNSKNRDQKLCLSARSVYCLKNDIGFKLQNFLIFKCVILESSNLIDFGSELYKETLTIFM